jgi:hypothetical protein
VALDAILEPPKLRVVVIGRANGPAAERPEKLKLVVVFLDYVANDARACRSSHRPRATPLN